MKGLVAHYILSQRKVEKKIRKDINKKLMQEFEDIQDLTFEEAVKYLEFSAGYKNILALD